MTKKRNLAVLSSGRIIAIEPWLTRAALAGGTLLLLFIITRLILNR
jgi:hypothetical protein